MSDTTQRDILFTLEVYTVQEDDEISDSEYVLYDEVEVTFSKASLKIKSNNALLLVWSRV